MVVYTIHCSVSTNHGLTVFISKVDESPGRTIAVNITPTLDLLHAVKNIVKTNKERIKLS